MYAEATASAPWAKFTTRVLRWMSTIARANAAYTAPWDSPSRVRKMNRCTSEPQVCVAEILVVAQRTGRRVGDDPAERHDDAAVGDRQRAADVLLDQQHGEPALVAQAGDERHDLGDDARRQAE